MGYDVSFFRVPAGMDLFEAHERLAEQAEGLDAKDIVAEIKREMKGFVRMDVEGPPGSIGVGNPRLEVMMTVTETSVELWTQYFGSNGRARMEAIVELEKLLRRRFGFRGVDWQLGVEVGAGVLEEMVSQYGSMPRDRTGLREFLITKDGMFEKQPFGEFERIPEGKYAVKPWWKFW